MTDLTAQSGFYGNPPPKTRKYLFSQPKKEKGLEKPLRNSIFPVKQVFVKAEQSDFFFARRPVCGILFV
jgi:hypothetical protein